MVTIDLTGKAVRMPAPLELELLHGFGVFPWLQGISFRRFPGVIFLLLMVPLTYPEQIAGVAINLQAMGREFPGTVPPVKTSIFDKRIFHENQINQAF